MESMGKKARPRRSFTPEFKAEIVELCQRGDRSIGQVTRDLDLTETAVPEWVKQAERDSGERDDRGLAQAEREELAWPGCVGTTVGCSRMWRSSSGPRLSSRRRPVDIYPFIEAENAGDHHVKRGCELPEVSRAAFYAQRTDQPSARAREDVELTEQIEGLHTESKGRCGAPR